MASADRSAPRFTHAIPYGRWWIPLVLSAVGFGYTIWEGLIGDGYPILSGQVLTGFALLGIVDPA